MRYTLCIAVLIRGGYSAWIHRARAAQQRTNFISKPGVAMKQPGVPPGFGDVLSGKHYVSAQHYEHEMK